MAPIGRPPKPTSIRILEGNPGKRALPKGEPQPAEGIPTRPGVLSLEGRHEWRRLTRALPPGLLTQVDRAVLAMACEAWADWVASMQTLRAEEWYYKTDKGYRGQHPAAMRMKSAREAYMGLASKLGLSPVDRVRLAMPEKHEQTLDEMMG